MIKDLLWACPVCQSFDALRLVEGREACVRCKSIFTRGRGSKIGIDIRGTGETIERSPGELVSALPAVALPRISGEGKGGSGEAAEPLSSSLPSRSGGSISASRVVARIATGEEAVYRRGKLMGMIERLGPPVSGRLELAADSLLFRSDEGEERHWPTDCITAIQASSSSLQIKVVGEYPVSFKFPETSPRRWELMLEEALRHHYRRLGRGEIVEFQPRITVRCST